MRLRVVGPVLLLGLLVCGAAFCLKRNFGQVHLPGQDARPVSTPPPSQAGTQPSNAPGRAPRAAEAPAIPLTPEQRQAANDAEIERLQQWGLDSDPRSLVNILADLSSSEKEIREAAIEAAKQFGDTNAIPVLKAAADQTEDAQEKIALLEAAQFLTVPPLVFDTGQPPPTPEQIQLQEQHRAQRLARRQAILQRQARAQEPPPAQDPNSQ